MAYHPEVKKGPVTSTRPKLPEIRKTESKSEWGLAEVLPARWAIVSVTIIVDLVMFMVHQWVGILLVSALGAGTELVRHISKLNRP